MAKKGQIFKLFQNHFFYIAKIYIHAIFVNKAPKLTVLWAKIGKKKCGQPLWWLLYNLMTFELGNKKKQFLKKISVSKIIKAKKMLKAYFSKKKNKTIL